METKTVKKRHFNDEKLSILQKIGLFFRNLRKAPSKNGQRRLIKNLTTGKWEWTEGVSLFPTTAESLIKS